MRISYFFYALLTSILFIPLFPCFWFYTRLTGRHAGHLKERLGFLPIEKVQRPSRGPKIWIHAASLGEVKVAAAIISALEDEIPGCSVILSTITASGRRFAEETFGKEIPAIYAPVDFVGAVRKSLSLVRPHVLVFLETEIWPNWLLQAHQMNIPTVLINGRISTRSVRRYLKARFFFREVLQYFEAFSMISAGDASRITDMGADPGKIEINGNAKYDLLATSANPAAEMEIRNIFQIKEEDRVFIAGSTRSREEAMILDAYEKILTRYPDLILVIAPRHVERVPEVAALLDKRGFAYQLRTELVHGEAVRTGQIIIVNTLGELFKIYSVGTIVFSGASLVPLGGQNPLEPAAWGRPVFYGPHMENFLDAQAMLEAVGAGIMVRDSEDLAGQAIRLLSHPDELRALGAQAKSAVLNHQGAAQKHAAVIKRLAQRFVQR